MGMVIRRRSDNEIQSTSSLVSFTQVIGMGGLLTKGLRNKPKDDQKKCSKSIQKKNKLRNDFPHEYCVTGNLSSKYCQNLAAVGKRQWGSGQWWDGRNMLNVDLYDFAIYLDSKQVQKTQPCLPQNNGSMRELVTSDSSVPMTLMLRAQRPLPVSILQKELGEVLSRRIVQVSRSEGDSGLNRFLKMLQIDNIPIHCLNGQNLTKGTTVAFQRDVDGKLTLRCGSRSLGQLQGVPVTAALFDLYLGDQPVCKKARYNIGQSVELMKNDTNYKFG
eukprot:TRINITY_DN17438_c0_g1_i2.p1 TRINITY_DN17438_c0_g1~~TRINITY_DN17438_c0_g1_i2.p1  ORF type:complete len:274 (+),score=17.06 TRINITY_DN17438_c0_g1_i2:519-1340(+)